jgi:hypothetical protein
MTDKPTQQTDKPTQQQVGPFTVTFGGKKIGPKSKRSN